MKKFQFESKILLPLSIAACLIIVVATFLYKLRDSYVGKYVYYENENTYEIVNLKLDNSFTLTLCEDSETIILRNGTWQRMNNLHDNFYTLVSTKYTGPSNDIRYTSYQYETNPTSLVSMLGGEINPNGKIYTKIS